MIIRCSGCKTEKHCGEFVKNRTKKSGFSDRCKECNMQRRKADYIKAVKEISKSHGCACWVCGLEFSYDSSHLFDMHHINPDKKIRSVKMDQWSKTMREESLKTALLCALCHRDFHRKERIANKIGSDYSLFDDCKYLPEGREWIQDAL